MTQEELNKIDVLCEGCEARLKVRLAPPAAGIPCVMVEGCKHCTGWIGRRKSKSKASKA